MPRKTPVKHVVRTHVRKRRNGQSWARVSAYTRGKGGYDFKSKKGTPGYLSERPSPSEVIRAGYGAGARVQLIAPQTGWNNQPMGEFGHPIGTKGTIAGHFGAEPIVQWDGGLRAQGTSGQVVNAKLLKVIGKTSTKKEIIASGNYDKIKKFAADYAYGFYEDGNKITVNQTEPVMDDAGFIVGDVEYQFIGKKVGNRIEFDTPKLVLTSVPRSLRSTYRMYFEETDPKDHFGGMFE